MAMPMNPGGSSPAQKYATAHTVEDFQANLAAVRKRIDDAAQRSGRDPAEVRLLPVSKTVPQERIRNAVAAGAVQLGENKIQEMSRKAQEMSDLDIHWAVIGHLQTNKARDVARSASEFQAVDRLKLAAALDRRLQTEGRSLDVYVQVNTSAEESKFGLAPDDTLDFLAQLAQFETLNVKGLMTLAIFSDDAERVRPCFQALRSLRDRAREQNPELIGAGELSMGMSGDFELAIEEGANVVRVGQAIFGARDTPDSDYWPPDQ